MFSYNCLLFSFYASLIALILLSFTYLLMIFISDHIHILNQLLPSVSAAAENYNLRPRKHNRLLPERATRLFDANFIYRNLYCDILLMKSKDYINIVIDAVAVYQPFI